MYGKIMTYDSTPLNDIHLQKKKIMAHDSTPLNDIQVQIDRLNAVLRIISAATKTSEMAALFIEHRQQVFVSAAWIGMNTKSDVIDVDNSMQMTEIRKKGRRKPTERFDPSPEEPEAKKRKAVNSTRKDDDDEVVVLSENTTEGSRKSSHNAVSVLIKNENPLEGKFKCPKCDNIVVASEKGCNVLTCRNHHPQFFYFCAHCKHECPDGISSCSCPKRNSMKSREVAVGAKNDSNRSNPIVL